MRTRSERREASRLPWWTVAGNAFQFLVGAAEFCAQQCVRLLWHRATWAGIVPVVSDVPRRMCAEEIGQDPELLVGFTEEDVTVDDVQLLPRYVLQKSLQLGGVVAPSGIGVVPVSEARVARVLQLRRFTFDTFILESQGEHKVLRLESASTLVFPGRVGSFDRVAQHHHDLRVGKVSCESWHGFGMEQVVTAGLKGERRSPGWGVATGGRKQGKVSCVPLWPAIVVEIEVIDALVETGPGDLGMLFEGTEKRCRTAPLPASNDEVRMDAPPGRRLSHQNCRIAPKLLHWSRCVRPEFHGVPISSFDPHEPATADGVMDLIDWADSSLPNRVTGRR